MGALAQHAYDYGNAVGPPPPVPVGVPSEIAAVAATPTTPATPSMASDMAEAAKLAPKAASSLIGAPAATSKPFSEVKPADVGDAVGSEVPGHGPLDTPTPMPAEAAPAAKPVAMATDGSFQDAGTPVAGKLPTLVASMIGQQATAAGIPPAFAQRVAYIESGGRANAKTGSYAGLFQLDQAGFRKFGGEGSITDPEANTKAGLASLKSDAEFLRGKLGRDPTPTEWYLAHQQGRGGVIQHIEHPDLPAWQNMLNTAEGQKKGAAWAKRAIWGNVPDRYKRQFGNVDNLTSRQFMDMWQHIFTGRRSGPRGSWYQSEA